MIQMKRNRSVQATLRMSPELKKEYEDLAEKDNRTFNQIVELALKLARPQIAKRIEMFESTGFQMSAAT